jgi:hypothetical protein
MDLTIDQRPRNSRCDSRAETVHGYFHLKPENMFGSITKHLLFALDIVVSFLTHSDTYIIPLY